MKQTITIAGIGYVGLSNVVLLAQYNQVYAYNIMPEKVEQINRRECPIIDQELQEYRNICQPDRSI